MNGIAHILSPSSAAWCSWTMLGLLLCAIMSEQFQPGIITQAKSSLLAKSDRTYKESPVTFMGQVMMALFRLGTITMALCLCRADTEQFLFSGFWITSGIVFAIVIIKMAGNLCLDYAFRLSRRFGAIYEHYGNIMTLVAIILYPILLGLLRFGNLTINRWIISGAAFLFILLWLYRSVRQFAISPKAIIYLLFYCCTMEIVPLVLMYILSEQTLSIL